MATGTDIKSHKATYEGFIKTATIGTIVVALVTIFVIMLITR